METEEFLGLTSTGWSGVYTLLTGGLLFVALVAALYAKRQWEIAQVQAAEARLSQREASRPYVIVAVEPTLASPHLFDLVVRNIGRRPALGVQIQLDPPPVTARSPQLYDLAEAKMLNEPIAMIAPDQEMRAFYDSHIERNGRDDLPTTHRAAISYRDSSGHTYNESSVLDIDAMKGTSFISVKTLHDLGTTLEEISKTLNRASVLSMRGSLDVDAAVESRGDQEQRQQREREEWKTRSQRFSADRGAQPGAVEGDDEVASHTPKGDSPQTSRPPTTPQPPSRG